MLQVDQECAGVRDRGVACGRMRVRRSRPGRAVGCADEIHHALEAIPAGHRFVCTSHVPSHPGNTSFRWLSLPSICILATARRLARFPLSAGRAGERGILLRVSAHGYLYAPPEPGRITAPQCMSRSLATGRGLPVWPVWHRAEGRHHVTSDPSRPARRIEIAAPACATSCEGRDRRNDALRHLPWRRSGRRRCHEEPPDLQAGIDIDRKKDV